MAGKRKGLEGVKGLVSPEDAVAHVARTATGEEAAPATRAPRRTRQAEPEREEGGPYFVTTVRLREAHWRALREEALNRARPGAGRSDASAVLRDLLDEWLAGRK